MEILDMISPLYEKGGSSDTLTQISVAEVARHSDYTSCWVVIFDKVYDVTKFLQIHPGGSEIIMESAGFDASLAFDGKGHSEEAQILLKEYLIGELPKNERTHNL